jgi:MoaA/NifB/PqqE/SkfB family radical SAM enzyme
MTRLIDAARPWLRAFAKRHPAAKRLMQLSRTRLGLAQHTVAQLAPQIIRPCARKLTVAVTANCNLRCVGCRYGRDFMPGQQLSLAMVESLLEDAKEAGIETVRLYGGEPLLHPALPAMVRSALALGLSPYVTTNGTLLKQKIEALYEAGLRNITIGFYGTGKDFDAYVQRDGRFHRLEDGVAAVRRCYGSSVSMQLNYLLMRPSCNLGALRDAWAFAERHDLEFGVDLIHYSLPYFTEGPNRELQFRPEDRPRIMEWVGELVRLKSAQPTRIKESLLSIYSIPDWLLAGPEMRVPCDAHKLIWVGADGSVQLCYAAFPLGNLHQKRLRDMLFSDAHYRAARGAFALDCPNCHCERETRILKHVQSRRRYQSMIRE